MKLIDYFNPARWSLSRQFISIVSLILLIPIASFSLLQEIEKTLVDNRLENLRLSSRLISNQLTDNLNWFEESLLPDSKQYFGKELFVFPLIHSFELDGYFSDDWSDYEVHRRRLEKGRRVTDISQKFETSISHIDSTEVLLGSFEKHLIVSIKVYDQAVVYTQGAGTNAADRIEIEFKLADNGIIKFDLAPRVAGNVPVRIYRDNSFGDNSFKVDWRYKAKWVATSNGFNVEIQFPSGVKPNSIRINHYDIDQSNQIEPKRTNALNDFSPLVWPSKKLVKYFDKLQLSPAQRIWILDSHRRVLASAGNLMDTEVRFSGNQLFNALLSSSTDIVLDPRKNHLKLDSKEVYLALTGVESAWVESSSNSDQAIALSALPIKNGEQVLGVLLLEENIAKVQILQRKTLIDIFGTVLVVFFLVVGVIFWSVSRMVNRIKLLNSAVEQVVDPFGRMKAPLALPLKKGDEIDELYASFSHMGTKLFEYNDHLEKLASRLSHELRTPIAIVRSSLDNLLLSCPEGEDKKTIERALQGNQRLGEIITRMRQASGVKEAMQTAKKESMNLEKFMRQVIEGYQVSFPEFEFQLHLDLTLKHYEMSPDLFLEMLDKLVSNAMEFCFSGTPIVIKLTQSQDEGALSVMNKGPLIPAKDLQRIFHSLVSIRTSQQSTGTNLGLGLYIVRLIAEFHQSIVSAENLDDRSGVVIKIRW